MHESIAATPVFDAADPESVRLRNERVMANQGLVITIAREIRSATISLADRVQDGNLGLMRAAEKFDLENGAEFSTYAAYCIRHAIYEGIFNASRIVRVPRHAWGKSREVERAASEVERAVGSPPSIAEAVAAMRLPGQASKGETYRMAAEAMRLRHVDDLFSDAAASIPAADDPEADAVAAEWRGRLARALTILAPDERRMTTLLYGLDGGPPVDLKVAARRMDLSIYTARRIKARAIDRLKDILDHE